MATIVSGGRAAQILNLTLSSSDDIQIGFSQPVNSFTIRCRSAIDIQVRTSRGAGNYFTIPAGQAFSFNIVGNAISGAVQPTNIWVRSASGTPVLEVLGLYGG